MADTDLAELRKLCVTSLYTVADNVSKYLDQEKEAELAKLSNYVQEYCLLEAQEDVATQALDRAKRETDDSNLDTLEERFSSNLSSLAGKRLNVKNHPYLIELTSRIKRGQEKARNNFDESDLAITESQDQHIDPITKKAITDPVKNRVCGHVYERESIMSLIQMKQRTKCPVAGCGNRGPIQKQDLVSDEELKFRMALTQHSTMIERSVLDLDDSGY